MATGDIFLKLDGVKGESKDSTHSDQIEVHSFSFGVSNAGSGGAGQGSGTGKASFGDLHISKLVDNAGPNLFINCCTGKHHPTATLYVRKAGEKPQEYMTFSMDEVFISSYQMSGSDGSGLPQESVSLNFSKLKYEYKIQNADGSLGAANPKTYSVKESKAS
jgi:type VI secretion system secreted protein Hcp